MSDKKKPAAKKPKTQTPEAAERLRKLHADCRRDYEQAKAYRDANSNRRRFW